MGVPNRALGKREFLELASVHGVLDVESIGTDTIYVFVRSGLSSAQTKFVRDLALEWWNLPRVLVTVRSGVTMKAAAPTTPTEFGASSKK